MIVVALVAGWFLGAASLAVGLGALMRWADVHGERAAAKADEPVYVPREWVA
jgi:hypothetical protein